MDPGFRREDENWELDGKFASDPRMPWPCMIPERL
jgi:hypothetical protein